MNRQTSYIFGASGRGRGGRRRLVAWGFSLAVVAVGCTLSTPYERAVAEGLASGVRYDSLFYGISFGMKAKAFYLHCWKMNQQGVMREGAGNMSVECVLPTELGEPALMNFYPTFYEGAIYEMPVLYAYQAWAPWNAHLSADTLLPRLVDYLEGVYGGSPFFAIEKEGKPTLWVKIDGNRRMVVYKDSGREVKATFTDMSLEKAYLQPATQTAKERR